MKVRFGAFVFDSSTRELLHETRPVHLSPKSFDLLQILIERRPALVTKAQLQDLLWPDADVLEANLGNAAAEIRKALGDNPKSPKYISTVSRRGYRFCAEAEELDARGSRPGHRSSGWWLAGKDIILPLAEGENIVGRHPESDVWIDAGSVSRSHACIVIAGGRAPVDDRQSTNGTFVNGARITSRHPLIDGTAVTFGSERAVFREWSDEKSPTTEPVRSGSGPGPRR
jgi:DNA-binding winged helix-turn-helix (wHTH) protein